MHQISVEAALPRFAVEIDSPPVVPLRRSETPWALDVLAVDDDPADAMLITEALRSNIHVRHVTTSDAPQSAVMSLVAGRLRPDLILVDASMPKLDGFKFVLAIREAPWMARTPVVMLTSSAYGRDVDHAKRVGISSYIVKPKSFQEMKTRIDGVIDQLVVGP
jgi:two-component system response regulator